MSHGDLRALADGALLDLARTGTPSGYYQRELAYAVQALTDEVERLQRTLARDDGRISDVLTLLPGYERAGIPMGPFRMILEGEL